MSKIIGRVALLFFLLVWGIRFIFSSPESNYAGESFMHLVNLPFHEAGHILFSIFGQFLSVLGGSIMQLLIPLICLATFILKTGDIFAASVALWWTGQNLIDLAPYINDARDLKLMLLGGVTGAEVDDYHDWEFILKRLGLLKCDHAIAMTAHVFGSILIISACIWGAWELWRQYVALKETAEY